MSAAQRRQLVRGVLAKQGPCTVQEVIHILPISYMQARQALEKVAIRGHDRRWRKTPCDPEKLLQAYDLVRRQGWPTSTASQLLGVPLDALVDAITDPRRIFGEPKTVER